MEKKKMSIEMMKAIMLAFQVCIKEEKNIFDIFKEFDIVDSEEGLIVLNPPIFQISKEEEEKKSE